MHQQQHQVLRAGEGLNDNKASNRAYIPSVLVSYQEGKNYSTLNPKVVTRDTELSVQPITQSSERRVSWVEGLKGDGELGGGGGGGGAENKISLVELKKNNLVSNLPIIINQYLTWNNCKKLSRFLIWLLIFIVAFRAILLSTILTDDGKGGQKEVKEEAEEGSRVNNQIEKQISNLNNLLYGLIQSPKFAPILTRNKTKTTSPQSSSAGLNSTVEINNISSSNRISTGLDFE